MDSRLQDMLTLVSRVHEKRGDIRYLLHEDPAVQREVHGYLDDLTWLGQRQPLHPNRLHLAAGKEQLLAALKGHAKRERKYRPARVLGATAAISLVLFLVITAQAATAGLPQPVDQVLNSVLFHRETQAEASLPEMSTPSGSVLEASSPGFTR